MNDVFVKKERKVEPGYNMRIVMNRKATAGEVGIEIEVEGNKFPKPPGFEGSHVAVKLPGSKFWSYVHDGSLRGQDNAEYVLSKPIDFSKAPDAIAEIYGALATHGSIIDDSNRTSVHVHMNCQEFHLNRLTSLMALWFTFEEILTAWCGEHRVGNLFCLRAKDAPAIIAQLRRFIKNDGQSPLSEHLHYAGLNAHALHKYGSIEVRTLRGCSDPQTVLDWLSILERLYKLSAEFEDPRGICALFSSEGPMAFFENVLGDKTVTVRSVIDFTDDQIRDSMYDGVRLAQDLCYCRDWGTYKPVKLKPDPWGRDMKKIAKKLQSAAPMNIEEAIAQVSSDYDPEPEFDDDANAMSQLATLAQQISPNPTMPLLQQVQQVTPVITPSDGWAEIYNTFGGSNG
jgi:hypothetical protein